MQLPPSQNLHTVLLRNFEKTNEMYDKFSGENFEFDEEAKFGKSNK
jgi:hypothetical protein